MLSGTPSLLPTRAHLQACEVGARRCPQPGLGAPSCGRTENAPRADLPGEGFAQLRPRARARRPLFRGSQNRVPQKGHGHTDSVTWGILAGVRVCRAAAASVSCTPVKAPGPFGAHAPTSDGAESESPSHPMGLRSVGAPQIVFPRPWSCTVTRSAPSTTSKCSLRPPDASARISAAGLLLRSAATWTHGSGPHWQPAPWEDCVLFSLGVYQELFSTLGVFSPWRCLALISGCQTGANIHPSLIALNGLDGARPHWGGVCCVESTIPNASVIKKRPQRHTWEQYAIRGPCGSLWLTAKTGHHS
ncbi:uncharacterized protein LOC128929707 [Callithrix jacchus]